MKIYKTREKGITMVTLVVTIIILIILSGVSINMIIGQDGLITIAKRAKENIELSQIEEQTKLNELYMQIEKEDGSLGDINIDFAEKINEFKRKIAEYIEEAGGIKPEPVETATAETFRESILGIVKEVTKDATAKPENITSGKTAYVNGEKITGTMPTLESQTKATATADKILKNYTAYVNGELVTGTMNNNGAVNQTLNAGGSYTIPAGYHSGAGKVTAASLSSQTQGTAIAGEILTGKTAWVNGNKVTGTMTNQGAKTATLNAGQSYTIPAGYHNGQGKVTANSLASQTEGTATADKILKDYTAYVNGKYIVGTMSNNGAVNKTLNAGQSYTILPGYHNGSGKVTAASLESQTQATATANDILTGKTAWVNGKLITGSKQETNIIRAFASNQYPNSYGTFNNAVIPIRADEQFGIINDENISLSNGKFTFNKDMKVNIIIKLYHYVDDQGRVTLNYNLNENTINIVENLKTPSTKPNIGEILVLKDINIKKGDIFYLTITATKIHYAADVIIF